MTKLITIVLLIGLFTLTSASWSSENHQYNGDAGKKVAAGIKQTLLANIGKISNESERNQLKSDLNTDDDGERKLMQISAQTASQIFEILQIKDPHCDTDHNGVIKGDEVKCLNIIWKAYLPH